MCVFSLVGSVAMVGVGVVMDADMGTCVGVCVGVDVGMVWVWLNELVLV